jgi:hypothetical protein
MKNLFNTFKLSVEQDLDMNQAIDQIEQQIIDDHKELIDGFILHSNRFLMAQLYVCFLPFFFIIAEIINWVFTDFMEVPLTFINESVRIGYFIFNSVVLLIFVIIARYER